MSSRNSKSPMSNKSSARSRKDVIDESMIDKEEEKDTGRSR